MATEDSASKKRTADKQLTRETSSNTTTTEASTAETSAPSFPVAPAEELAARKIVKPHTKSAHEAAAPDATAPATAEAKPNKPKPFSFGADVGGTFAGLAAGAPFKFEFKLPAPSTTSPFAHLTAPNAASSSSSPFSFAAPPSAAAAAAEEGDENPEREVAAHEGSAKVAELPKDQLKTGEEDEDTALEVAPAKLYRLEKAESEDKPREWKEVCRGTFRIKIHKSTGRARLLMRAEATLAVKLNVAVMHEIGCSVDGATGKAVSLMVVETPEGASAPEAASYVVRVGQKDKAEAIVAKIREIASKAKPAEEKKKKEGGGDETKPAAESH